MKLIPLTRGLSALVSNQDFKAVSQVRWYAQKCGTSFYAARRIGPRIVLLHKVIRPVSKTQIVDHRDLDTLNCQRRNLRAASHSQNHGNQKKYPGIWSSRCKGVCYAPQVNARNPWIAYINHGPERRYLGYFSTEEEAGIAYDRAARAEFGKFARLNF